MITFLGLFLEGFVVVCCAVLREACRTKWSGGYVEQAIHLHGTLSTNRQHPAKKTSQLWAFPADCVVKRLLVEQLVVSVWLLIVVYRHLCLVLVPLWCTREAAREAAFDVRRWSVCSEEKILDSFSCALFKKLKKMHFKKYIKIIINK